MNTRSHELEGTCSARELEKRAARQLRSAQANLGEARRFVSKQTIERCEAIVADCLKHQPSKSYTLPVSLSREAHCAIR